MVSSDRDPAAAGYTIVVAMRLAGCLGTFATPALSPKSYFPTEKCPAIPKGKGSPGC
jgi:hypothetical protein